ncbi:RNA polymerase sigma factor [Falsiroseomonas sp. HW251]|uniref:RNA polymerase sigma factor n=1 Tax=Falsiroseomonas sp. HW251 TaxID=3390998 RepID=UPI003D323922
MTDDAALVARLRAGEEAAFAELVRAQHGRLLRLVRGFCRGSRATAEEVVQEVWVAVLTGLDRYTGEAPLGAWMAGIAVNKARTRTARDGRMLLFSDFAQSEMDGESGSGLDPDRFRADDHWNAPISDWDEGTPERAAGDREMLEHLAAALETLPPAQRTVVTLRDIEGLDGPEVCRILGVTEGNMRVLLHRARTRLRAALEAAMHPAYVTQRQSGGLNNGAAAPKGGGVS